MSWNDLSKRAIKLINKADERITKYMKLWINESIYETFISYNRREHNWMHIIRQYSELYPVNPARCNLSKERWEAGCAFLSQNGCSTWSRAYWPENTDDKAGNALHGRLWIYGVRDTLVFSYLRSGSADIFLTAARRTGLTNDHSVTYNVICVSISCYRYWRQTQRIW